MDEEFKLKVFHLLKQQTETILRLEERVGELVEANNYAMTLLAELDQRVTALEWAPRLILGEDCPEQIEQVLTSLADEWSVFQSGLTERVDDLHEHVRAIDDRLGSKSGRIYDVLARVDEMERERWKGLSK